MAVDLPETTKTLGTRSVFIIPKADLADPDAAGALTVAKLMAAFKATAYIYGNGAAVTGEQQKGDAPKKLAERKTREQLGTVKEAISDVEYSYKPQADNTDPANACKAACQPQTQVYVVDRLGVLDEEDPAADQWFNVSLVTLGIQNRGQTGDDDFAEYSITQGAAVDNTWWDIKSVAP